MTPAQNLTSWRSRIGILAVTSITVLALAGCSGTEAPGPPTSEISSTPNAEPTPMFASDDEALAAAELAYRNYIAVSDEIARDGGADIERIESIVTSDMFIQDSRASALYSTGKLHAAGFTAVESFRFQSLNNTSTESVLAAYVCLRFDALRILDDQGADVTPASRSNSLPLVVRMISIEPTPFFLMSSSEVWSGSNFC
jgi:hypothetical protein